MTGTVQPIGVMPPQTAAAGQTSPTNAQTASTPQGAQATTSVSATSSISVAASSESSSGGEPAQALALLLLTLALLEMLFGENKEEGSDSGGLAMLAMLAGSGEESSSFQMSTSSSYDSTGEAVTLEAGPQQIDVMA